MPWIMYTPPAKPASSRPPTATVRLNIICFNGPAAELLGLVEGRNYSVQVNSEDKALRIVAQPDDKSGVYAPQMRHPKTGGWRLTATGLGAFIGPQKVHVYKVVPAEGGQPAHLKRVIPVAKQEPVRHKAALPLGDRKHQAYQATMLQLQTHNRIPPGWLQEMMDDHNLTKAEAKAALLNAQDKYAEGLRP